MTERLKEWNLFSPLLTSLWLCSSMFLSVWPKSNMFLRLSVRIQQERIQQQGYKLILFHLSALHI